VLPKCRKQRGDARRFIRGPELSATAPLRRMTLAAVFSSCPPAIIDIYCQLEYQDRTIDESYEPWSDFTEKEVKEFQPHHIRAVLFDLDGTLLDTAPDLASAINELRREKGLDPLPFNEVRPLVSHGARALVRLAFPQHGSGVVFEELRTRFLDIYRGRLSVQTRPYEGLLDALGDLESGGIAWGVVTNKPGWLTEPLLEQLALRDRAGVVVSGDTLPERKPHPAPLLHAAHSLGVAPAQCIYVGDAERDVLAARAAGMDVFVALFGYLSADEHPKDWPANGWLDSPQALARLLGSICNRR
jgi:phosphoglycolate phosphatase